MSTHARTHKQSRTARNNNTRRSPYESRVLKYKVVEQAGNQPYDAVTRARATIVTTSLLTSGNSYAYKKYQSNDAYDPDITGSGTSWAGKLSTSDRYFNFRARGYSWKASAGNKEAFPGLISSLETNTDPGSLGADFIEATPLGFGQVHMMGPLTGNSVVHMTGKYRTYLEITGTKAYLTDDSYAGNIASASPTDKTWLTFQYSTVGQANATNGCLLVVKLKIDFDFYGRLSDVSAFSQYAPAPPSKPEEDTNDVLNDVTAQLCTFADQIASLKTRKTLPH